MSSSLTIDSTGISGYVDPLAQSFLIERPLYVTKINVYFSAKDDQLPVTLSLRNMNNGLPSTTVIPKSQVVKTSLEVQISDTGTTATTFTFTEPVFLDTGEYCFVLTADTTNYRVWISEFGQKDIATGSIITKQPYAGTLFKSQNGYTWEANQLQDIKFELYRAKFTSTSATVDLTYPTDITGLAYTLVKLDTDPFESYAGNSIVRVSHPDHGFSTGSSVRFFGIAPFKELQPYANIKLNNIPIAAMDEVTFTVANVSRDYYTISLGTNAATTANIVSGRFGGISISASTNLPYSAIHPSISRFSPSKTSVDHKIRTTDTSYTLSQFTRVSGDTIEFTGTKLLASPINSQLSMSNSTSLVYRLELSTEDDYLSPVINLPLSSAIFVTNQVNNPTSTDNLIYDNKLISNSNVRITFTSTGVVTFLGSNEQSNVKAMVPGAFITIGGNTINSGSYRLVTVSPTGNSIVIARDGNTTPIANAEPTGNTVTILYRPKYIAEEAATGSSTKAKYFTRKIELKNPSTALVLKMAASTPANSSIEVYYKTQNVGELATFSTKEFTRLDLGTLKTTLTNEFIDFEKTVEGLTQFTALVLKIVLKSTDISSVPKVKDLRIIALE